MITSGTNLEPEALQRLSLPLKILDRVIVIDVVTFEKPVDFVACFKAEQPPQIGFVKTTLPGIPPQPALRVPGARAGRPLDHAPGDVVGDMNGNIHGNHAARFRARLNQ